jgi:hypothetical protein
MLRWGHPRGCATALLCAIAVGIGGCGGDDGDDEKARPSAEPTGKADPNKDPFLATCDEFLNSPDLYSQGTVKLSRRMRLRDANEYQVTLRLRNAITDICDKSGGGDYRPARAALHAVKRGEYTTDRG